MINDIEPEAWSEHLAFVRAGGIEIGHLAAPPRTAASVAGAARNIRIATAVVGSAPLMENIATLIDPPCSTRNEQSWIADILSAGGCGLLLDLHNIYANATNFGFDPLHFLAEIPLDRVGCIHIAGGRWIASPDASKRYWLDDHLHEVGDPVYDLIEVAARAPQPLTMILERDGTYPPMPVLLAEFIAPVRRSRPAGAAAKRNRPMQADVERLLARLFTDPDLRERFIADPKSVASQAGLSEQESETIARMKFRTCAPPHAATNTNATPRANPSQTWFSRWFRAKR